jgi:restriction system protein
MGRRSGVLGLINAIARDAARSQRQALAAQQKYARDRERAARTLARQTQQHSRRLEAEQKRLDRELKQLYLEDRQAETDDLNTELIESIEDLRSILSRTLGVDDTVRFDTLRISEVYPPLDVPPGLTQRHPNPVRETFERIPFVSQPVAQWSACFTVKTGRITGYFGSGRNGVIGSSANFNKPAGLGVKRTVLGWLN